MVTRVAGHMTTYSRRGETEVAEDHSVVPIAVSGAAAMQNAQKTSKSALPLLQTMTQQKPRSEKKS